MALEEVKLTVEGRAYTGWKSIVLTRSIEALCGSFRLEVVDDVRNLGKKSRFPVPEGAACQVNVGRDLYLSGFVDSIEAAFGPREHRVTVEGRDKAADFVDCSPVDLPLEFYDLSLFELAVELATPFGLGVVSTEEDEGENFERFSLQVGESAHEALERACRLRGFLQQSNATGALFLTRAGLERSSRAIVQGEDLLVSATLRLDQSGRFHRYVARGQAPGSDTSSGAGCAEAIAEAIDPIPRKTRTLAIVPEGNVDDEGAKLRVTWEANVRAARAQQLTVKVRGWRELEGGFLWKPNRLVSVEIPTLRVSGDWLIAGVQLARSVDGGTTSELGLVRPDAYLPEPPRPDLEVEFGADLEEAE